MDDLNDSIVVRLNSLYENSLLIKGLVIFGAEILPYVLAGIVVMWALAGNRRKKIPQATMVFFAALVAIAAADMLKYWFNAPRPFMVLDNLRALSVHDPYGSFPSAHMTFFTALAMAMLKRNSTLSGVLFAGAFVIGVSRIVAGVHFPVDIIGGFFLGAGIAYMIGYCEGKYYERYSLKRLLFWRR